MKASSLRSLAILLIFAFGLLVRLFDFTDLPLDFHPTRQLVSAIKARGMYYQDRVDVPEWQRKFAVRQWHAKAEIEPEIIERLVAFTYRFAGEQLWIGRLYSCFFWLAGAVFLYLLATRLSSSLAALAGVSVYLFLPYAVIASRSFQPDPLMVMSILAFWWALEHWDAHRRAQAAAEVRWAALAGLLGGLAILIKFSAAFFVIGAGLGLALVAEPLSLLRRPSIWIMAALGALPGLIYLVYGIFFAGFLGQQFSGRFIPSLLISPSFYLNWLSTLIQVFGLLLLPLALIGMFFFKEKPAWIFMLSLWIAYLAYGFFFDYHIWSHDYYNLPAIPVVALSIGPLVEWIGSGLCPTLAGSRSKQVAVILILLFGLFSVLWNIRGILKSVDYRPEAKMWEQIGADLGSQARVVALTQDYGSRLVYWGWLDPVVWPLSGDILYHSGLRGARQDFEKRFSDLALKRDFFLVTLPVELQLQPLLAERLAAYPVYRQGDGYVIYDLR
jgi:4-amino-4-deoxy-L-arabinose transferase-like glycosyltransferase